MMRPISGIRLLAVSGILLGGGLFCGCDNRPPADALPAKTVPAPGAAAKPGSTTPSSGVSETKAESSPVASEEERQGTRQASPKQPPVEQPIREGIKDDSVPTQAAQEPADQVGKPTVEEEPAGFLPNTPLERKFPFEIPAGWKRLSEQEEIWIDNQEKMVIVSGRICLTRGLLEMFACPKGMKEHESVVSTYPMAMYVHQALLLIGVNPGKTVQWEPEYKPAEGPKIQVECWYYNEKNELVKQNAKEMVKLVSDGSPLKIDWVFGGSKFIVDPDGRELYAANGGELICLSNFSSAMIDLPIPSTAEAGGLLFEANPEKIPPLDTPVLLVLKPEMPAEAKKADPGDGK